MSALAQRAYEQYFKKNTDSNFPVHEWFESPEEPEYHVQTDNSFGRWVDAIQTVRLNVNQRKIKSASSTKVTVVRGAFRPDRTVVISSNSRSLESEFRELAAKWKEETKLTSSLGEVILNTSYQRIIGLGRDVIPFVLNDLRERGGHWFWALQALSGENPVAEEDAGRTRKMTEAWLKWGSGKGLI